MDGGIKLASEAATECFKCSYVRGPGKSAAFHIKNKKDDDGTNTENKRRFHHFSCMNGYSEKYPSPLPLLTMPIHPRERLHRAMKPRPQLANNPNGGVILHLTHIRLSSEDTRSTRIR